MKRQTTSFAICVGSANPVKVAAARVAAARLRKCSLQKVSVTFQEVASQIRAQPLSDEETKLGAQNRALAAWQQACRRARPGTLCLGLGLEGGIMSTPEGWWSTVWGAVYDGHDFFEAAGGRIALPRALSRRLVKGEEMGDVLGELSSQPLLRQKQGMFGLATGGVVTRTQEYTNIATAALGIWYGRGWFERLKS